MKRIRNLVIGGIQNKVFNLILFTVILLTAVFLAVAAYHSYMLAKLANETAGLQQDSIQEITDSVMDKVINRSMGDSALMEAYIADELFHGLKTRVEMMDEYAGKLFSDPAAYPRLRTDEPDPRQNGKVKTQLIYADGVDAGNEELQDRIGLAGNMSDMMVSLFGASDQTNSCFIALPDGVFLVTDDRTASKFDKNGKKISYDPRTRPWYKQAVEKKGLIFTDVEIDAFTGDIGIVCAMPVYADGKLAAVVGSDLFLTSMDEAVKASEADGSYVSIINQYGHVVFSPKTEGEFRVMSSAQAKDLRQSDNTELAAFIEDALNNNTEMRLINLSDGAYYMIGAPMKTVGWTLVSLCSQEAVGQPSALLRENYEKIQDNTTRVYREKSRYSRLTALVLLLTVAVLMLSGALILAGRIVKPLNNITKRISELKEGDLEFKMQDEYRTGDEIEELAESFASLSRKTLEYLDEIKNVTAEKERISTELSLATDIQAAMIPHVFPAFPGRPEFDLYASMDPAKEVGGDFYDYFLVDDDHLCILIADVSGKGVPAALFMMASKIILQSYATAGITVGEILARTNSAICSNNEAGMFITVWLGILELSSGKMTAANAGHEYPVLKQPGEDFILYKDKHGFVIGGMEGMKYHEYNLSLVPGSKLFVYTDGVVEATNAEGELFGSERLLTALNEQTEASPRELLKQVTDAVDEFVKDAEQFDDLTMLCLEYKG